MSTQDEALKNIGRHEVVKRHDDGDLTVKDTDGCLHVVTTEGETFTEQGCACPQGGKLKPDDCAGLREVLFTIYDSMSTMAGGKETAQAPELGLLEREVEKLVGKGILHKSYQAKVVPGYKESVEKGDGQQAHFFSRILFRDAVDQLKNQCSGTGNPGPKRSGERRLVDAQRVSDFDLRTDKVVRRGDHTYIVDTSGHKADTQVASDVITPEIEDNLKKLTPEQKAKMRIAIQNTPFLSAEGKSERLAILDRS